MNASTNEAADITEARAKLRDLAAYMPEADRFLCTFAAILAEYLNDRMVPEGVNIAVELLTHDCRRGKGGYASVTLPAELTGMPSMVYVVLGMSVQSIIDSTFPEPFAARVKAVREELRAAVA